MCFSTCLCVHQTDCRTIFSVNSLGQAVPLERDRSKVSVCVRPSHSVKGTLASRGLQSFSDSRVETNMSEKHPF